MQQAAGEKKFSRLIGQIDIEIGKPASSSDDKAQLYCNRGLCNQRLNLNRKALKDYDEALSVRPGHILAHLRKGMVLQALKRPEEARRCWQRAEELFQPQHDLLLLLEAQSLLAGVSPPPLGAAGISLASSPSTETPAAATAEPSPAAAQAPSRPQAKAQHAYANGSASASAASRAKAGRAAAKDPSALVRAACLDHATGVGIAVSHINEGKLEESMEILDYIISATIGPHNTGAHIARGTARAMLRDLEGAVEDFSVTIKEMPVYADAWMRRGQARAAMGEDEDSLQDFEQCLKLTSEPARKAEALTEIGKLLHKQRNYRTAAAQLQKAVDLKPDSLQARTFLGLCQVSMGEIQLGASNYERVLKLDPDNLDACVYLAQARKEEASVEAAEKAFNRARVVDKGRQRLSQLARMLAHMCQGLGQHRRAIDILTEALNSDLSPDATVECLHLRGACHHALGSHREAVKDYESAFSVTSKDLGDDARSRQFLTFYQREMALYTRSNEGRPVEDYCLDHDLHPVFKELWCKKMPPTAKLFQVYRPQDKSVLDQASAKPDLDTESTRSLIRTADSLGKLLQYRQQGFLPNVRQLRMAGLAVLELAQAVRAVVDARKAGSPLLAPSGASASKETHTFGWRDAMDIIVKWRQLSEPNDQVIWVDLLTEEEFTAGFGSHTPIFTGQTKCARYYMNFERALALLKEVLAEEGKAFDANNKPVPLAGEHKQAELQDVRTAEYMWRAIGADSWVVVPIQSAARPGHVMEGTRLTLVKLRDQPDGYEFSIKTPVTPPRWQDYNKELQVLWEQVLEGLEAGDGPGAARSILTFAYFWYNFMPLARGTAAAGYIFILSLFLAAGMPVTASIPKGYQVDWEAILSRSSEPFVASVSAWLYPPAARGEPAAQAPHQAPAPELAQLPAVKQVLGSARARLEALNAPLPAKGQS